MDLVERSTQLGRLRGYRRIGVQSFLGIRYGEPPARFRPCAPAGRWTGVRDATVPGNQAMQGDDWTLTGPWPATEKSEDCLFLNVHAPDSAPAPLPVIVWIHGGSFTGGSANHYDGTALASAAGVVVVTINYRLGLFGTLDMRSTGTDFKDAVNVWLTDQLTALRWVRDNIADYGGDPGNVTVMGQSAGATSAITLASLAEGADLMRRAAAFSPAFVLAEVPDQLAVIAGVKGLSPDDVPAYALAAPAEELVALTQMLTPQPFVDGTVIPADPHVAIGGRGIPLITGMAPGEGKFLNTLLTARGLPPQVLGMVAHGMAPLVARGVDVATPYIARLTKVHPPEDDLELSDLVWTDLFRRSSITAAEAVAAGGSPAWHYLFDVPCTLEGVSLPSTHCVDLPFTFNWFDDPDHDPAGDLSVPDAANPDLARRWVSMLSSYARTGDPGDSLGPWPRYSTETRVSRHITNGLITAIEDLDPEYRLHVWPEG